MKKVDHESRRAEVAAVAARLIAEKGLEALTTRALAKELGCSIGVLSHYFNSKEEIVDAAFLWADKRIDERMAKAMAESDQSIDAFVPVLQAGLPLDQDSDLEWRVRMNLYISAFTNEHLLAITREKQLSFRQQLPALLTEWQQAGALRDDIPASRIAAIAFDLVVGAAHNLLRIPMADRPAYAGYLFEMVEQLKVPASARVSGAA